MRNLRGAGQGIGRWAINDSKGISLDYTKRGTDDVQGVAVGLGKFPINSDESR